MDRLVISLGGSIIVPDEIDTPYLRGFVSLLEEINRKFIIICGGGKICRRYQDASREIGEIDKDNLDWIGIMASRLNAELVRAIFGKKAFERVVYDPFEDISTDKIIVGAAQKPGSSTDLRAVQFAAKQNAGKVINISNIDYVYDKDPKKYANALPIEKISWKDFRKIVGDSWNPGLNVPFDPIASREAQNAGLEVICMGSDLVNLRNLLVGSSYRGTLIHP